MSWSWQTHRNRSFRSHLRQPERSLNHFSIFQVFSSPNWSPHHRFNPPHNIAQFVLCDDGKVDDDNDDDQTHLEDDVVQLVLGEVFIHLFQDGSEPLNWNEPLPLNVKQPEWKIILFLELFEFHAQWYRWSTKDHKKSHPPTHVVDKAIKAKTFYTINYSCRQERRERWQK